VFQRSEDHKQEIIKKQNNHSDTDYII
jgi:hypothetical protein